MCVTCSDVLVYLLWETTGTFMFLKSLSRNAYMNRSVMTAVIANTPQPNLMLFGTWIKSKKMPTILCAVIAITKTTNTTETIRKASAADDFECEIDLLARLCLTGTVSIGVTSIVFSLFLSGCLLVPGLTRDWWRVVLIAISSSRWLL